MAEGIAVDLSKIFKLGKPKKKIVYARREYISNELRYDATNLRRLISESIGAQRYYDTLALSDKAFNGTYDLDAFEITVRPLNVTGIRNSENYATLRNLTWDDINPSIKTLDPNAIGIMNVRNERPGNYELQQVYDGIHKHFYVILDMPARFIQWTAPEPAIKQRAIIDLYNSLIAKTVDDRLKKCGLVDPAEKSYSTNEVRLNKDPNSIRITRVLDDRLVEYLKSQIRTLVAETVLSFKDSAIKKFLSVYNIDQDKFIKQIADKFTDISTKRFYFDLKIGGNDDESNSN